MKTNKTVELSQENLEKAMKFFGSNFGSEGTVTNIFKAATPGLEDIKGLENLSEMPTIMKGMVDDINKAHTATQAIIIEQNGVIETQAGKITELEGLIKGQTDDFGVLKGEVEKIANTPLPAKSTTNAYMEKAVDKGALGEQKEGTFLSLATNKKEINDLLGSKMEGEIQKGMGEGDFTKAAVSFEAQGQLTPQVINLLKKENIFIVR